MKIDTISVLAGGWSAAGINRANLPGVVIGVNDSMIHAPCDIGVSMDRLWTEHRWQSLKTATLVERIGGRDLREVWIRARPCLMNIAKDDRPDWLREFACDWTTAVFSETPGTLNGTNSGVCALNLAWQMQPRRVLMFGFDMNRNPKTGRAYWFPDYEWAKPGGGTSNGRYATWAREFGDIARAFRRRRIEVLNCSTTSAITVFPKMDPAKVTP